MQSQLKRLQNFDAEDEAQLSADRVTAKVGGRVRHFVICREHVDGPSVALNQRIESLICRCLLFAGSGGLGAGGARQRVQEAVQPGDFEAYPGHSLTSLIASSFTRLV